MEFIIIITITVLFVILSYIALNIHIKDLKKLKSLGYDDKFDDILKKTKEDKKIAEDILDILNNTTTKVEKDNGKSCVYVVTSDKIFIPNMEKNVAKIQTIAHECVHSVQNKKTLWFNFILTNLYNIFFLILVILSLFNIVKNNEVLNILILIFSAVSFLQFYIRMYLENDAMTRARYIAKDYLDIDDSYTKKEKEKLISRYDEINKIGINLYDFKLLLENAIKIVIVCLVSIF